MEQDWSAWNLWAGTLIKQALDRHELAMIDATVEFISEQMNKQARSLARELTTSHATVRRQTLREVDRLREEIDQLKSELTLLRAVSRGKVRQTRGRSGAA